MNLQSIIITNCLGIAMLVVLLISSHISRLRRRDEDRLYNVLILLTASACLIEMATYIIDGRSFAGQRALAYLGNSYLFFANVTVSFLWCLYTDIRLYHSADRVRQFYRRLGIPALISYALLLLNLPLHFVFSIDSENVYHREAVGYAFYLPTLGYLIFSVVLRERFVRRHRKPEFFPIWMFLTPIFIGATVQAVIYGVSAGWCSTALGLIGMYMSEQNELSYLDPLTKLFNRSYLDQKLAELRQSGKPTGGLMIDIDSFKSINDRFGHTVGDRALTDTAYIISRAVPEGALVIRFAGDEFVVLCDGGDLAFMNEVKEAVLMELERWTAKHERPYKLSFSVGAASCDLSAETDDAFLTAMDERMYEMKRLVHNAAGVTFR